MADQGKQLFEIEAAGGNSADFVLKVKGIQAPNIPTTDPHVAGQLYSDSGTVKVSAG